MKKFIILIIAVNVLSFSNIAVAECQVQMTRCLQECVILGDNSQSCRDNCYVRFKVCNG